MRPQKPPILPVGLRRGQGFWSRRFFRAGRVMEAWDDGQLLDILDRTERLGESMAEVGERYGVSRGAVAGVLKRIRDDLAKACAAPLRRGEVAAYWPENLDGGMAARWWDAGLRQRKAPRKPPISTQGRR